MAKPGAPVNATEAFAQRVCQKTFLSLSCPPHCEFIEQVFMLRTRGGCLTLPARGEPLLAIARQAHRNCRHIPRGIGVFGSGSGFLVIFLSDLLPRWGSTKEENRTVDIQRLTPIFGSAVSQLRNAAVPAGRLDQDPRADLSLALAH